MEQGMTIHRGRAGTMWSRLCVLVAIGGVLSAAPERADAQATPPVRSLVPSKKDKSDDEVPESHLPPPGMCRVWIDGVPAAQQPAPTDCPTAIRNRPSNARVIFADDSRPRRDREGKGEKGDADDDKRNRKRRKPDG
jgi:hypothetical protein